ncbi:TonB-dependent receptor [Flavilitoribacter nigricans]|nr:carboxypeptidase-like regulatory domain-containing protein [Flavilitoribacter nigricans]
MKRYTLLLGLQLGLLAVLSGQSGDPEYILNKNFNGQAFTTFVTEVEAAHDLQFYYFPGWTSELQVVQNQTPATLSEVLTSTFADTDYHFFIQPNGQVILTQGKTIRPEIQLMDPAEIAARNSAENVAVISAAERQLKDFETEWIIIGDPAAPEQKPRVKLSGFVRNTDTDRPLPEAIVFVEELQSGTTTDSLGYYELNLPQGKYRILYQSIGLKETSRNVQLFAGGQVNAGLGALILDMEEVVVRANRQEHVRSTQMGVEALKIETIKQLPALLGEVDIVRSALMLPGVQTVGEFSSGINVRGGGSDQNLILLNGAPVFNASHLFGFSSSFSPDVIEGFELYKSSIPAKFGGRISSVLDLEMKQGDLEDWSLKGGISPVTSRITVEGPIVKDRSSLIVSGRSTYSDWILKRIRDASFRNSRANYYDLTTRYKTRIGQNDQLDASLYLSRDFFKLNGDTTFAYQNRNAVVNYRKGFGEKLFGTFSGIYSHYRFNVGSDAQAIRSFDLAYQIDHLEGKAHFSYAPDDKHQINFGAGLINYRLDPGSIEPDSPESIVVPRQLDKERALEGSIYVSDEWTVSDKFSVQAGLRLTQYLFLGPQKVYNYQENAARIEENIVDSTLYSGGSIVQRYGGPEYRMSLRYSLGPNSSLKAAFNRNRQYLSMLFNSATVSPTATWKLSDSHIRPQTGDQFSLGLFKNMLEDRLEFSLEGYYKLIRNMVEYKAGAELLLNDRLETDVVNGEGRAYGLEVLFKKNGRKLNGWMSYTYSRTRFRADSPYAEDRINQGEWFPTNFDKPHDFSFVAFYRASRRFSFSTNIAYSTGRPITIPVAKYQYANGVRLQYSRRNEFRVPDYFRWDLSVNLEGSHKLKKLAHSSWSLSLYNVTGRQNVYSIYFVSDGTTARGYQLSIFGKPFFTLTYNFRI